MNEGLGMLRDLVERLLRDGCDRETRELAERGAWPSALWRRIEEAELATLAVPEELGGAGMSLADAMVVAHAVGRHAAPVPVVESVIGNWLLSAVGQRPLAGVVTVPAPYESQLSLSRSGNRWALSGDVECVPWAAEAAHVVIVARRSGGGDVVLSLARGEFEVRAGRSTAFEPRAALRFDNVAIADEAVEAGADVSSGQALLLAGALARCHQMAGAMEWTVEQSVTYANDRAQFGKPIAGFQAVQHMLAVMAGHSCAATAAADAALGALGSDDFEDAVAMAKSRIGEAAGEVAAIAHQIHGAMGYCREFPLHSRTRRLWCWRDEFGAERKWQVRLGRAVSARGAEALWPRLADMN